VKGNGIGPVAGSLQFQHLSGRTENTTRILSQDFPSKIQKRHRLEQHGLFNNIVYLLFMFYITTRYTVAAGRSRVRFPIGSLRFFIDLILPAALRTPASNRNDYQGYILGGKGGRCVGLTTLPPSCADV
jgi:hypothetical protein